MTALEISWSWTPSAPPNLTLEPAGLSQISAYTTQHSSCLALLAAADMHFLY